MDTKIVVSEDDRKELIEYYKGKLEIASRELEAILEKKKSYENMLVQLINNSETHAVNSLSKYETAWSWMLKITYVLKKANRTLRTKDIVDALIVLDHTSDRDKYTSSVSAIISQKLDTAFRRYKDDTTGEFFIGLMEWYNDEKIRHDYFPLPF
jgi:hypothetical protein